MENQRPLGGPSSWGSRLKRPEASVAGRLPLYKSGRFHYLTELELRDNSISHGRQAGIEFN